MKKRKWSIQEQAWFLKRIGELLLRGYPLAEAIESMSFHLKKERKAEVHEVAKSLKEGYSFHQILFKLRFNNHLIGYVYFAEQHGGLGEAIKDGSSIMLKRSQDMQRLSKLLYYPLLLILITGGLFLVVEQVLLPKFTSLFRSMKLEENFFTKVVSSFGTSFPYFLMMLTVFVLLLLLYYQYFFKKLSPLEKQTRLTKIPLFGMIFRLFLTHYFSVQLSYLLSGGLSVLEALTLFEQNDQQPFYKHVGIDMKEKLISGEKLEQILFSYPFFENDLAKIVKHGQENGKLDQELFFYSQYCLELLEEKTEKWLKTIQPILFSFIGFLIISMYLAVLLPMFHLLDGF